MAKKPKMPPIQETTVAVLIDKSGSMMSKAADVIGGFNAYLGDLQTNDQAATIRLFITLFDTNVTALIRDTPVADVVKLTPATYRPGGLTALLDAVGQTLREMEDKIGVGRRVLFVIMTDGQENSSREYRKADIRQMIEEREKRGNWTFVYMGADQDAFAEAGAFGIHAGSTMTHDSADYKGAINRLRSSTGEYLTSGGLATRRFFGPEGEAEDA